MRRFLFILPFLSSLAFAGGPKSTFPEPRGLDAEVNNIYHDINFPAISTGTAQNFTIINATITNLGLASGRYVNFQAPVIATTITPFSTTSNTYQSVGFSNSIIPTSSTHRVKVTFSGTIRSAKPNTSPPYITIKRGSTDLGNANGNGFVIATTSVDTFMEVPFSVSFIDSPATTSSTAYVIYLKSTDNVTTVSFNANAVTAVIILEEVL